MSSEGSHDLFGDMALDEDLFTALGAMGRLIGPYGRVWEVGLRLKGGEVDEAARQRRDSARGLWRALLKGEWMFGKRLHDAGKGEGLLLDAPSEAVLLAALLLMGGYSDAADRLIAQITSKRRVRPSAAPREVTLLRALDGALDGKQEGHAALRELVAERGTPPVLKQVAMALLFHARVARKDEEGAREAANALWGEAETARRELEAMGERPFGGRRQASPAKAPMRRSSKEKAVAR